MITKKSSLSHPDTLDVLYKLGNLHQDLGNYKLAEEMFKKALNARVIKLGDSHPSTLESLNNLANLYRKIGHFSEAEAMYKNCLEVNFNLILPV